MSKNVNVNSNSVVATLDQVILKNNENLLKNGFEVEKIAKFNNLSGKEDLLVNYGKYNWKIVKNSFNKNIFINLEFKAKHGTGNKITIQKRLTPIQIEYITNKMGQLNNGVVLRLKTRFIYGKKANGDYYISCIVLIGGKAKYADSTFLDDMQVEIILDNMSNIESCYDIYMEQKLPGEEIILEDNISSSTPVVDID